MSGDDSVLLSAARPQARAASTTTPIPQASFDADSLPPGVIRRAHVNHKKIEKYSGAHGRANYTVRCFARRRLTRSRKKEITQNIAYQKYSGVDEITRGRSFDTTSRHCFMPP